MSDFFKVKDNGVEPWRDIGTDWRDEMPKGWVNLTMTLERTLEDIKKENPEFEFDVGQLKEKFGSIRMYYTTSNLTEEQKDRVDEAVDQMERTSECICSKCGAIAVVRSKGWIMPYCRSCAAEMKKCDELEVNLYYTRIEPRL